MSKYKPKFTVSGPGVVSVDPKSVYESSGAKEQIKAAGEVVAKAVNSSIDGKNKEIDHLRKENDRLREALFRTNQDAKNGFVDSKGHVCSAKNKCEAIVQRTEQALKETE